jgi:hypothetical protein
VDTITQADLLKVIEWLAVEEAVYCFPIL